MGSNRTVCSCVAIVSAIFLTYLQETTREASTAPRSRTPARTRVCPYSTTCACTSARTFTPSRGHRALRYLYWLGRTYDSPGSDMG